MTESCSVTRCRRKSVTDCDFPLSQMVTCDASLCALHAVQVDTVTIFCPTHAAYVAERALGKES